MQRIQFFHINYFIAKQSQDFQFCQLVKVFNLGNFVKTQIQPFQVNQQIQTFYQESSNGLHNKNGIYICGWTNRWRKYSVFRRVIKIKSKIIGTTWWFLEPVILSIKLLSRNNLVRLCNRVKLSIFTIFMNSNLKIMFRNYQMFNEINILLLSVYSAKMESQKSY